MEGGLAVFGWCLFLMSIANLYARTSYWMAVSTLLLSVLSMGMAFSESKKLRELSLGISIALLSLTIIGLAVGARWWLTLASFLFASAYAILWAEYRFAFFGNVRQQDLPAHHANRMHMHWPWQRRRTV